MSSGAQIETDWMGVTPASAEGGASGTWAPLNGAAGGGNDAGGGNGTDAGNGGASGTAHLTDEEILGMELPSHNGGFGGPGRQDGTRATTAPPDSASTTNARQDGAHRSSDQQSGDISRDATRLLEAEMPAWMAALSGDPKVGAEARQLWQEHQEFRAAFSSAEEARAMRELLPGGAQEVQALRQIAQEVDSLRVVAQEAESLRACTESLREAAQSVDRIDAAIFSGDVRAQSEVVTELARANPAAFRSLFAEAAKVLAGMGQTVSGGNQSRPDASFNSQNNAGASATRRDSPVATSSQGLSRNDNLRDAASYQSPATRHELPGTDHQSPATSQRSPDNSRSQVASHQSANNRQSTNGAEQSANFDPAAYASFERATNDVVARDVRGSINDTLTRVMPEGVAEGAARRIGDDIFNEVHRALAADRTLSEQVGEVLRERRFGTAEHQRVAALVAGRAKQIVPSVARRVIGEWTSSALGTARNKAARQAAAASRIDIAAPGGSLDSMPLRAMSSREVNYASMSDDDILGM